MRSFLEPPVDQVDRVRRIDDAVIVGIGRGLAVVGAGYPEEEADEDGDGIPDVEDAVVVGVTATENREGDGASCVIDRRQWNGTPDVVGHHVAYGRISQAIDELEG